MVENKEGEVLIILIAQIFKKLIENSIYLLLTCLFAGIPTSLCPSSVNATVEGVVLWPSEFSITLALFPSMIATHEFVVPKSIPIMLKK